MSLTLYSASIFSVIIHCLYIQASGLRALRAKYEINSTYKNVSLFCWFVLRPLRKIGKRNGKGSSNCSTKGNFDVNLREERLKKDP